MKCICGKEKAIKISATWLCISCIKKLINNEIIKNLEKKYTNKNIQKNN